MQHELGCEGKWDATWHATRGTLRSTTVRCPRECKVLTAGGSQDTNCAEPWLGRCRERRNSVTREGKCYKQWKNCASAHALALSFSGLFWGVRNLAIAFVLGKLPLQVVGECPAEVELSNETEVGTIGAPIPERSALEIATFVVYGIISCPSVLRSWESSCSYV